MDTITKSCLLILRGIFPNDFLSADQYAHELKEIEVAYTDIPKKFTSVATWLTSSNLKCWNCDLYTNSFPKFIPLNYEMDISGDICEPYGNFCEWNCAAAYISKEFPKDQQRDLLYTLTLFESKFSGKRKERIVPTLPKTLMKCYSGNKGLTQKQWKSKMEELNKENTLIIYKTNHFTK